MPKCLLNSIRGGYRAEKYVKELDNDSNIMTTRSGLSIRKVHLKRNTGTNNPRTSPCAEFKQDKKVKPPQKKYPVIKYRSLSYLSFVTRYYLNLDIPDLELTGVNPQETIEYIDDYPYNYQSVSRFCRNPDENHLSREISMITDEISESETDDMCDDVFDDEEYESSSDNCEECVSEDKLRQHVLDHFSHIRALNIDDYRRTLQEKVREAKTVVSPSQSVASDISKLHLSTTTVSSMNLTPSPVPIARASLPFGISTLVVPSHSVSSCLEFKCEECNKAFVTQSSYMTHMKTHDKNIRNKCSICGKVFSRSWLLKGHMRTHTGERPFQCPNENCDKAFADKSNLRSHMMIHNVKSKNFTCKNCGRSFAQKRYLHKHLLEVCRFSSNS